MDLNQACLDLQRALQADYVLVFSTDEDWGPNNQATFRLLKYDENSGEGGHVEEIDLTQDDVHSIITQASQNE